MGSVVAVHGLNGDGFKSWEYRSSSDSAKPKGTRTISSEASTTEPVFWLRDLLPDSLPNARIFTFSYNSAYVGKNSSEALRNIAQTLLAGLDSTRQNLAEVYICPPPLGT